MMTLTHQHANRKFMRIWSDSEKLHCWAKSKFLIWLLFYNNSNFVHRAYCWNTSYHLSARSNPLFQFYLIVLRSCWHLLTHVFNHVKQMAVVSQARYHRYKGAFNFFFFGRPRCSQREFAPLRGKGTYILGHRGVYTTLYTWVWRTDAHNKGHAFPQKRHAWLLTFVVL
jgi:hypothetical protein